jgi:exodeoxyribonuclease V gamma subunit
MATLNQQNHSGSRPSGLPVRLIVFGISSLPMQAVQALAGLGQVCQVLMLVQNPCQYYWGDLVEGNAALRQQVRRRQKLKAPADAQAGSALARGMVMVPDMPAFARGVCQRVRAGLPRAALGTAQSA